ELEIREVAALLGPLDHEVALDAARLDDTPGEIDEAALAGEKVLEPHHQALGAGPGRELENHHLPHGLAGVGGDDLELLRSGALLRPEGLHQASRQPQPLRSLDVAAPSPERRGGNPNVDLDRAPPVDL